MDESDRPELALQTLNAEHLLRVLDGPTDAGPVGCPAPVWWAVLIARVVYRLPEIADLRRHLQTNPYPRCV